MGKILAIFILLLSVYSCDYVLDEYNLKSLELGNETSGSFFLGCGSIGGEIIYFAYLTDGVIIKPVKLPIQRVTIIEYDGEPKIKFKKSFFSLSKINFNISRRYTIYIPKGSIKNEFNVNLN